MTLSLPSFRHLSLSTPFPLKSCGNISRNFTLQRKDTSSPCPNGKYSYQHQVPVESLSYARCWATATRGYLATGYPPSILLAARNLIFHRVYLSSSARRGCLYCAAPPSLSPPCLPPKEKPAWFPERRPQPPRPRKTQAHAGRRGQAPTEQSAHAHAQRRPAASSQLGSSNAASIPLPRFPSSAP